MFGFVFHQKIKTVLPQLIHLIIEMNSYEIRDFVSKSNKKKVFLFLSFIANNKLNTFFFFYTDSGAIQNTRGKYVFFSYFFFLN